MGRFITFYYKQLLFVLFSTGCNQINCILDNMPAVNQIKGIENLSGGLKVFHRVGKKGKNAEKLEIQQPPNIKSGYGNSQCKIGV